MLEELEKGKRKRGSEKEGCLQKAQAILSLKQQPQTLLFEQGAAGMVLKSDLHWIHPVLAPVPSNLFYYWINHHFFLYCNKSSTPFALDLHLKLRSKWWNWRTITAIIPSATQQRFQTEINAEAPCAPQLQELLSSFSPCTLLEHFILPKVNTQPSGTLLKYTGDSVLALHPSKS